MKVMRWVGPILLIILFAVVAFISFDSETAAGLTALLFLIWLQLAYLGRRIKRVEPGLDQARLGQALQNLKAQAQVQALKAPKPRPEAIKPIKLKPAPEPEVPKDAPTQIDPSVFSKFQQKLEQSSGPKHKPVKPAPPPDLADEEVVLNLSSNPLKPKPKAKAKPNKIEATTYGRNGAAPSSPENPGQVPILEQTQTKEQRDNKLLEKIPAEPLGDLFDEDLDPASEEAVPKNIQPKPRRPQRDTHGNLPPLESNEELTLSEPDLPDTTELQLRAAKKVLGDNPDKALELVSNWKNTEGKGQQKRETRLAFAKIESDALFKKKDYNRHIQLWQGLFKDLIPRDAKEYLPLLEERIDEYVAAQEIERAVPFLLTALGAYQGEQDYIRMDQTYGSLENAYRNIKDPKSLVQCLQNHLSVKKSLSDYPGQLRILDELGKVLFDQGDQQGSRKCYEQSIELRREMELARP